MSDEQKPTKPQWQQTAESELADMRQQLVSLHKELGVVEANAAPHIQQLRRLEQMITAQQAAITKWEAILAAEGVKE